jgi:hypothetical protein
MSAGAEDTEGMILRQMKNSNPEKISIQPKPMQQSNRWTRFNHHSSSFGMKFEHMVPAKV